MNVEETLHQLNELGPAYIQEKTHISLLAINAILQQEFNIISPIQYAGFLNIFENELHIDVTALRDALKEHNQEHNIGDKDDQLFVYSEKEQERKKFLYIGSAVVIFILILLFSLADTNEEIVPVSKHSAILEASTSLDQNFSLVEEEDDGIAKFNPIAVKEAETEQSLPFIVYPKGDLWIGTIDLDTKVKKDTITNKPYALDENINMLISLGHGQVKVVLNGETIDTDSSKRLRYLYKDGVLTKISLTEFKELNDGNSW